MNQYVFDIDGHGNEKIVSANDQQEALQKLIAMLSETEYAEALNAGAFTLIRSES